MPQRRTEIVQLFSFWLIFSTIFLAFRPCVVFLCVSLVSYSNYATLEGKNAPRIEGDHQLMTTCLQLALKRISFSFRQVLSIDCLWVRHISINLDSQAIENFDRFGSSAVFHHFGTGFHRLASFKFENWLFCHWFRPISWESQPNSGRPFQTWLNRFHFFEAEHPPVWKRTVFFLSIFIQN